MDQDRSESIVPSLEIVSYPGCLSCASRPEEESLTIDNAALTERDILTLLFVLLEKRSLNFDIKLIDQDVQFDRSKYTTDVPNVIIVPSYFLHTEDEGAFENSVQVVKKSQFLNAPFTRSQDAVAPFIMFILVEAFLPLPATKVPKSDSAAAETTTPTPKLESHWSILCLTCHNAYEPIEISYLDPSAYVSKVTKFEGLFKDIPKTHLQRIEQYAHLFLGTRVDLDNYQVTHIPLFKQHDSYNSGIIAALNICWTLQENGRLIANPDRGTNLKDYEEQRSIDEARSWLGYTYRSRLREKRKRSTKCYEYEDDEVVNFESPPQAIPTHVETPISKISANGNGHASSDSVKSSQSTSLDSPGDANKENIPVKRENGTDHEKQAAYFFPQYDNGQYVSRYLTPEMRLTIAKVFEMLSIENVVKKDIFPIFPASHATHTAPNVRISSFTPIKFRVTSRISATPRRNSNGSTTSNTNDDDNESANGALSPSSAAPEDSFISKLRALTEYIQNFDFVVNFCPKEAKVFSAEELEDLRSHFLKKVAFPSAFVKTLMAANEKINVTKETILVAIRNTIKSIQVPESFEPDAELKEFLKLWDKDNIKDLFMLESAMSYETTKLGRGKKLLCKYRDPLHFDRTSGTLELKYRKGDPSEAKPRESDVTGDEPTPTKSKSKSTVNNSNNCNASNLRQGELVVSALDINFVVDYALQMFDDRDVPKPSKYVPQALQSLARQKYYTTTKALMKVFNNHFNRNEPPPKKRKLLEKLEIIGAEN